VDDPQLGDAVAIQIQALETATEEMGTVGEVIFDQISEGGQDAVVDLLGTGQGAAVNRGGGSEPKPLAGSGHRSFRRN